MIERSVAYNVPGLIPAMLLETFQTDRTDVCGPLALETPEEKTAGLPAAVDSRRPGRRTLEAAQTNCTDVVGSSPRRCSKKSTGLPAAADATAMTSLSAASTDTGMDTTTGWKPGELAITTIGSTRGCT